jgi:pilus assembly protein CpaB
MSSERSEEPVLGKSATFEVTPEQAQKLALATQAGTLSLSLRNYAALEEEKTSQLSAGDLGEKKAAPPPVKAAPRPVDNSVYVNVRKGTSVEQEKVSH